MAGTARSVQPPGCMCCMLEADMRRGHAVAVRVMQLHHVLAATAWAADRSAWTAG